MEEIKRIGLLLSVLLPLAASVQAQDAQRGALIYETYCGGCHYERVHERPPERSIVKSRAQLQVQVERWAPQTKRAFTVEEIRDVVEYLDRMHYRF